MKILNKICMMINIFYFFWFNVFDFSICLLLKYLYEKKLEFSGNLFLFIDLYFCLIF